MAPVRQVDHLLTGGRLLSFEHWRQTTLQALAEEEVALLNASNEAGAAEQLRQARTRRRVVTTLAAATIVSIVLAVVALVRTGQATEQTRIAEVRGLAASAIASLDTDPELSLLLALEAVEREPLPEVQEALHQAIVAQRIMMSFPATGGAAVYLDDSTVAALNEDGTISIYDIASGEPEKTTTLGSPGWLETARTGTTSTQMVAIDRGKILAVGTADGFLVVVDVATGAELWERVKIGERSPQISATLDGSFIAARAWVELGGSVAGAVIETSTGSRVSDLSRPFGSPGVAVTGHLPTDQATMILDMPDIHFVPVSAGTIEPVLTGNGYGEIIAAGRNRYLALSRTTLGEVVVGVVGIESALATYQGHQSDVWDLDMDFRETRAVSGGSDGTARVWSMITGEEQLVLPGSRGGIVSVDLASNGERLLTVGAEGSALIWDVTPEGGSEVVVYQHSSQDDPWSAGREFFRNETQPSHYTAFNLGGTEVVVRAVDSLPETTLLDIDTEENTYLAHSAGEATVISPDTGSLAIARKGVVNEYGIDGGPPRIYGEVRPETVSPLVAYSPSGQRLAVGSADGIVDVFDTATQNRLETLAVGDITSLLFAVSENVVTTDGSGRVRIWENGKAAREFEIGPRIGNAAIHSNVIIASDFAGSWSAVDLESEATVHALRFAHAGGINSIAISQAEPLMATAGRDGTVKLWDLEDGSELMTLARLDVPLSSVAFSDDGTMLAVADSLFVRVYTLDVDGLVEIGRSKVTRRLTDVECRQYLHSECPTDGLERP